MKLSYLVDINYQWFGNFEKLTVKNCSRYQQYS